MPRGIDQHAFNVMFTHMLTQKERAMKNGDCAYRENGGKRCAVGALIPDDASDEVFNYVGGVKRLTLKYPDLGLKGMSEAKLADVDLGLLEFCQNMHDAEDPETWHDELTHYADRIGYTLPTLEN